MPPTDQTNQRIADKLREMADLLEQQGGNPFRVGAYRRAADTVAHLDRDLVSILDGEGVDGLTALPNIGKGIAGSIEEVLRTGRWARLDRIRGTLDPERVFQTVPGIGPHLAKAIHDELHIDTLEGLEIAAQDGRLEDVAGIGPRRAAVIRAALGSMLGRVGRPRRPADGGPEASVLLDVDAEYRKKAKKGGLPTIAPRRFNPEGKSWLPILHTQRGEWHFTALFSNTARAHQLGRTDDWVVVYFYDHHHHEGQHTVVTETRGPLIGRRVVRGRERECLAFYRRE